MTALGSLLVCVACNCDEVDCFESRVTVRVYLDGELTEPDALTMKRWNNDGSDVLGSCGGSGVCDLEFAPGSPCEIVVTLAGEEQRVYCEDLTVHGGGSRCCDAYYASTSVEFES